MCWVRCWGGLTDFEVNFTQGLEWSPTPSQIASLHGIVRLLAYTPIFLSI